MISICQTPTVLIVASYPGWSVALWMKRMMRSLTRTPSLVSVFDEYHRLLLTCFAESIVQHVPTSTSTKFQGNLETPFVEVSSPCAGSLERTEMSQRNKVRSFQKIKYLSWFYLAILASLQVCVIWRKTLEMQPDGKRIRYISVCLLSFDDGVTLACLYLTVGRKKTTKGAESQRGPWPEAEKQPKTDCECSDDSVAFADHSHDRSPYKSNLIARFHQILTRAAASWEASRPLLSLLFVQSRETHRRTGKAILVLARIKRWYLQSNASSASYWSQDRSSALNHNASWRLRLLNTFGYTRMSFRYLMAFWIVYVYLSYTLAYRFNATTALLRFLPLHHTSEDASKKWLALMCQNLLD